MRPQWLRLPNVPNFLDRFSFLEIGLKGWSAKMDERKNLPLAELWNFIFIGIMFCQKSLDRKSLFISFFEFEKFTSQLWSWFIFYFVSYTVSTIWESRIIFPALVHSYFVNNRDFFFHLFLDPLGSWVLGWICKLLFFPHSDWSGIEKRETPN